MRRTLLCVALGALPLVACAGAPERVISCPLGQLGEHTVTLLQAQPIADTHLYSVQKDHAPAEPLYPKDDDEEDSGLHASRGFDIRVDCQGSPEKVLVASGEFTANALQGVLVRYNSKHAQWERIDFAERARPIAAYLRADEIALVIPSGMHETSKTYLIYHYHSGQGQPPEPTDSNDLPQGQGWQVIPLKQAVP